VEGLPGDGDFVFLHGLQQGGLRLGRCAVDFIRQHHVGKYRPLHEFECAATRGAVFLEHLRSG